MNLQNLKEGQYYYSPDTKEYYITHSCSWGVSSDSWEPFLCQGRLECGSGGISLVPIKKIRDGGEISLEILIKYGICASSEFASKCKRVSRLQVMLAHL